MNLQALLQGLVKVKASDLHLKVYSKPIMRLNSKLLPVDHPELTPDDMQQALDLILPPQQRETFESEGATDFAYQIEGVGRYRVAALRQRGAITIVIRRINLQIPAVDELGLPEPVQNLVRHSRGMILVTGVTGSGKSTTMAAILNHINENRRTHIVTLEDPIEYVFHDSKSIVNQVEVGVDALSFAQSMSRVLRWDPDIIMIGEMRNRETVESAIAAADTGHMVLSTLHTSDAKQTINRVLYFYKKEEEHLVLEQLSLNLKAIISQRLLPRCDVKGLVPCVEFLLNIPIVQKLIREGKIDDLDQVLKNRAEGMQSFDVALALLVRAGKIEKETAFEFCGDEASVKRMIRGEFQTSDQSGLIGN